MLKRTKLVDGRLLMMLGLGLLIFGAGSSQCFSQSDKQEATAGADRAAILRVIAQFIDAYNAGDATRLADTYSADLVYMPQGVATLAGKEARESNVQFFRDTFSRYKAHLVVHVEELKVHGDMAFDRGTVEVTLTPKAVGEKRVFNRRFLEIWRKEKDGKWRVLLAMNNTE